MSKYSRIFHHITVDDVKRKKRENIVLEKYKEEQERKKEEELIEIEKIKSDWRTELDEKALQEQMMTTSTVFSYAIDAEPDVNLADIDAGLAGSFAPNEDPLVAATDYGAAGQPGGMFYTNVASNGSGSGDGGGFDVDASYLQFKGGYPYGSDVQAPDSRFAALDPIDCLEMDTIIVTGIMGNGSNGGRNPTVGDYGPHDSDDAALWVYYSLPGVTDEMTPLSINPNGDDAPEGYDFYGDAIIMPGNPDAGSGWQQKGGGASLQDYVLSIPEWARSSATQFYLVQPFFYGTANSTAGGPNFGVTRVRYQRRTPISVVVSLDSPQASSFIRDGSPAGWKGDRKKRLRELRRQLRASRSYTDNRFGRYFPGSMSIPPGLDVTASPLGYSQMRGRWESPAEFNRQQPAEFNRQQPAEFNRAANQRAHRSQWGSGGGSFRNLDPRASFAKMDATNAILQKGLTKQPGRSLRSWWDQGRNVRVPNERTASWSRLRADDRQQIGKFRNPRTGRIEGGSLPNLRKGYQVRQFATGRGGITRTLNPFLGRGQGLRSGPTPLARQQLERPFRNLKARTTNVSRTVRNWVRNVRSQQNQTSASQRRSINTAKKQARANFRARIDASINQDSRWNVTSRDKYGREIKRITGSKNRTPTSTNRTNRVLSAVRNYGMKRGLRTAATFAARRIAPKLIPGIGWISTAYDVYTGGKAVYNWWKGRNQQQVHSKPSTPRVRRTSPKPRRVKSRTRRTYTSRSRSTSRRTTSRRTTTRRSTSRRTSPKPQRSYSYKRTSPKTQRGKSYSTSPKPQRSYKTRRVGGQGGLRLGATTQRSNNRTRRYSSSTRKTPRKTQAQRSRDVGKRSTQKKGVWGRIKSLFSRKKSTSPNRSQRRSRYSRRYKQRNDFEMQGNILMETKLKKPKAFFKKADIKPVYPEDPPPEPINGWHPDLVDGEKVSNRYNKLDPISAKAMPKTGNPHIDKKVAKAAKKPKVKKPRVMKHLNVEDVRQKNIELKQQKPQVIIESVEPVKHVDWRSDLGTVLEG